VYLGESSEVISSTKNMAKQKQKKMIEPLSTAHCQKTPSGTPARVNGMLCVIFKQISDKSQKCLLTFGPIT
jgi:hypothetical protein